jgi:hypothetical protein
MNQDQRLEWSYTKRSQRLISTIIASLDPRHALIADVAEHLKELLARLCRGSKHATISSRSVPTFKVLFNYHSHFLCILNTNLRAIKLS